MKLRGKSRDAEQGSTWDSQLWFDCKFSPNSQFWSVWHSVCPHCTLHLDTPGLHFIDFIFQMKIRRGNECWSSAMYYVHYIWSMINDQWSYPVDMGIFEEIEIFNVSWFHCQPLLENFLVFDGKITKWKIEDVLLCRYFLSRIITAGKHHWILEQDMKRHQWVI